jgi:hypothetical protein
MALQYRTGMHNQTIQTWEPARAICENQPIHFPSQGNCSSKAYEKLRHLVNSWNVRSQSKVA